MKYPKFFLFLLIILLLNNCSRKQNFDFSQNWPWKQLQNETENEEVLNFIKYLQKQLKIQEAHYIFNEVNNLKRPEELVKLYELEKNQKSTGGSFHGIIRDFFTVPTQIPTPDSFDSKIATVFYLTKIRSMVNRSLLTSGMMYSLKFKNKEMLPLKREKSGLDLTINTSYIEKTLELFYQENIKDIAVEKNLQDSVVAHMLKSINSMAIYRNGQVTTMNIGGFIKIALSDKPINRIWNWINPCNNFGYSELYRNKDEYLKLINYLKNNKQLFEDKILEKLDMYISKDLEYEQTIEFGVNFGLDTWADTNYIGVNIINFKDNFKLYIYALRKEIFNQLHQKIVVKSPDLIIKETFSKEDTEYWNFNNPKDRKLYKVLSYIYQEGTSLYIGGVSRNYDYFSYAKESKEFINQIFSLIYSGRNQDALQSTIKYVSTPMGKFTGLGYMMARQIDKTFGNEELARCITKGPLYFFKKYIEFQNIKKSKRYSYLEKDIQNRIIELYEMQIQQIKGV